MPMRGPGQSAEVQAAFESVIYTLPLEFRVNKWFTEPETVKKMYTPVSRSLSVQNEEVILVGFFQSDLDFGNILENSERIKIKERALAPDEITFTDGTWQNLNKDDIARQSVVVTDLSETIEWKEGTDYEIDYSSGKIRRLISSGSPGSAKGTGTGTGSAIETTAISFSVENAVKVHYQYFAAKVKDLDYSINYEKGSLARKEGGSMVSGVKIFVDYRVNELIQNEVVELAIDQAHTWIINRIGIEFEADPDDNLRYAEAYYSLYLISKMSAANLIYEKRNDDVEEAAKELKLISEDYRDISFSFLSDHLTFPAHKNTIVNRKNISN